MLAVVHPTYAIFLWIPFVGFLLVRALWTRQDLRPGSVVLAALAVPAAFFMLWLLPIVADTESVSPDRDEVERAFEQYPGQLDIRSETSYSLAPEVFTRSGPVAIAALLLIPLAAFAARRRWAAFVVGGSLAVLAFMLVPLLFTLLSDLVSISQARRAAGFLPFAFAFAGGLAVLSRVLWPWLPPIALVAGAVLQYLYPGDFDYAFDDPGPAWVVWFAVVGCAAALVVGFVRRSRPPVEDTAGLAAALFLLPVVAVGLAKWSPIATPPLALLSPGLVEAVRDNVPERAIVYSDQETSYRIAAAAPVYIAVAPPGHVADTMVNRPRERARDAREFLRTGDLAIPARYGAEYLVVDRARGRRDYDLQELYRDVRFVLYRLAAGAVAAAAGRLDPQEVAGVDVDRRERGQLLAVQEVAARETVASAGRAPRREAPALGQEGEAAALEDAELADDSFPSGVAPGAARAAAQLVALHAERVRELERLDRRVEGVRHRNVHRGRAGTVGAGALSAGDRLVVGEALVAEDDVVHRPLTLRRDLDRLRERREHDVDDPARRLGVAGGHRSGGAGVHETALGREDGDRGERASRRREIRRSQAAHDVEAGGARDRERAVEVPAMLGRGSFEVDFDHVSGDRHRSPDLEEPVGRLERIGSLVASVRQLAQLRADDALRVGEELVHRGCHPCAPAPGAELVDSPVRERVRCELCAQVAPPFVRIAHPADEILERRRVEAGRRDHDPFLRERRRPGRQAAGVGAADVGVVRARHRVPERRASDDREVGEVRSARVGVVQDPRLARLGVVRADGGDRLRHGAEVDGDVLRLRDHVARLVEERGGAVTALLDVGRERGADEDRAHLLGDRPQAAADDLELDVDHVALRSTSVPWGSVLPAQPSGTQAVEPASSSTRGPRTASSGPLTSIGGAGLISAVRTATSSSARSGSA